MRKAFTREVRTWKSGGLRSVLVPVLCLTSSSLVSLGADLRIEGLHSMSEGEALDLLGDRLELIRTKPPSTSRAADAAFLLENLMKRQGFQRPDVRPVISGNAIRLVVNEGPRIKIGSVAVPGFEKEDQERLSRLFKLPGQERVLRPGQEPPFREADVPEGLSLLEADFRSRGYWRAKAVVEKRGETNGEIAFMIRITPGPLHHLGAPRFDGAPQELMARLQATAAPHVGKVANTDLLTTLRSEIESVFRSTGYPLETYKMNRILGDATLTPRFIIKFGERQRLSEVLVAGTEKTKTERITKRFDDLRGEWFDAEEFDKRLKKLLATGAFASMRIENATDENGMLDATLQVVEGRARGASVYGGFGSYEGGVLGLKYHDRNFGGNLWNFSTGVEVSSRGVLGDIRLSDPWLFDTDTYLGLRLFSVTRALEGYDKFETGVSAEFSRDDFGQYLDASIMLGSSIVNTSSNNIPVTQLGETVYGHHYIRADVTYDRRDDPVTPGKGYHLNAAAQGGLIAGDVSSSYFRVDLSGASYIPVGKKGQVNLGARASMLSPSTGISEFPIDLRLFTGGADTVRSFRYNELGPRSVTNDPLGGATYWVANAEYVHVLFGPVKGVGFIDAGSMSALEDGFSFDSPELAVGMGLRIDLPVGPIRIEYGHNLTQDGNESSGTWHFAIGTAF
ncbi:BamA/TamA family outer membrane protein [Luteolibacter flavescens]|uniref:BamA/TamA family outer membrane protein n=1 Tax=Luteolibacter flavescens TaxID=1859460 RepID=A0ABT3FT96_9BACT|nr:BamA/TamA family outer membrane protein [Luteolibacter flavescens]MCW1886793.1 BamA/TamA family outer membrane protein [Luteolibacter flavescens]